MNIMQQSRSAAWTTMIVIWWKKRGRQLSLLEMMAGGEDAANELFTGMVASLHCQADVTAGQCPSG